VHVDFEFSAEQDELRAAARAVLERYSLRATVRQIVGDPGVASGQRPHDQLFDRALWGHLAAQGWLGIELPADVGGTGLGSVESCILAEEVGRAMAPVPFLPTLLAATALHRAGETDSVAQLLDGSHIGCVAFGNQPAVAAPIADLVIRACGDRLEVVDVETVRHEPAMDRTRPVGRIDDDLAGRALGGADAVADLVDRAAVGTSAQLLGGAVAMLELATEYAKTREQFGRPIGSFQAVKHHCADMVVDVECMRSVLWWAAWSVQEREPDASIAASSAKAWCAEAGLRVIETALQVFGGIGFTWDHDGHLYLKRAQLDALTFGSARTHRDRLASLLRTQLPSGLLLT
jgi:alkylation response protein AidB-like acyl-CoA dehydrogenase